LSRRDLSGSFWKLRQRFGIAAPKVAIHSHVPWYWRWVGLAVLLGVAAASAAWFYDAGRRFAGFDRSEVQQELARVTGELEAARAELEELRAIASAADSRVSIERTAQQKLAQQIRTLEKENARVREELATFESMISSEARNAPTLSIFRFKVEPDLLPGEFRYRLLLVTPSTRRERDFNGRLELVVNLTEGDQNVMMSFPEPADADAGAFRLAFKYFRRVEGTFRVNPKAKVESVQVRVYETGSTQPRATHSVSL
jgi:multidrug efflux pump subunit AcrA (membrane-fusion protein)